MKKSILYSIAILMITLNGHGQTLIKLKQLQTTPSPGSVIVTVGTPGVPTYTASLPASIIPTLSAYVPYTGATGSVNLGANNFSVGAVGYVTNTLNVGVGSGTFVGGHLSVVNATGSAIGTIYTQTNNAYSQLSMGANTSTSATIFFHAGSGIVSAGIYKKNSGYIQSFSELYTIDNAGTSGSVCIATQSNARVMITDLGRVGINNSAPTKTFDVTGTGAFSQSLTTAGISNTGTLMCTSTSTFMGQIDVDGGSISLTGNRYIGSNNNAFSIRSNNSPRMNFDATGNIQMTPTSSVSLTGLLQVSSTLSVTGTSTVNGLMRGNAGALLSIGTSSTFIGERSSSFPAIWFGVGPTATTTSNYGIGGDGTNTYLQSGSGSIFFHYNGTQRYGFRTTYATFAPQAISGGGDITFQFSAPAHLAQTASANLPVFKLTGAVKQFATGAHASLYFVHLTANTLAYVGASTANDVYNFYSEDVVAGTNATITRKWAAGFGGNIQVNGTLNLEGYTVATLPAGVVGDVAYVTDALAPAYLVAVVGGGSVKTPVFFDGTNWVAH